MRKEKVGEWIKGQERKNQSDFPVPNTHTHTHIYLAGGLGPSLAGDIMRWFLADSGEGNLKEGSRRMRKTLVPEAQWPSPQSTSASHLRCRSLLSGPMLTCQEVLFVPPQIMTRTRLPPLSPPGQAPSSVTGLSSQPLKWSPCFCPYSHLFSMQQPAPLRNTVRSCHSSAGSFSEGSASHSE